MTRFIVFALPLLLSACGPSEEDINNIAIVTCNVIGESRNMDAAMRIKEINSARERIGAEPFLGTDRQIREAVELGICRHLVKGTEYEKKKEARLRAKEARLRAIAEAEAAYEAELAERTQKNAVAFKKKLGEYIRRESYAPKLLRVDGDSTVDNYPNAYTESITHKLTITCIPGLIGDLEIRYRFADEIIKSSFLADTCQSGYDRSNGIPTPVGVDTSYVTFQGPDYYVQNVSDATWEKVKTIRTEDILDSIISIEMKVEGVYLSKDAKRRSRIFDRIGIQENEFTFKDSRYSELDRKVQGHNVSPISLPVKIVRNSRVSETRAVVR
ncbi:hypothetical protein N9D87_00785 [bacterium]|nr:hypothetical protein [bacterium]